MTEGTGQPAVAEGTGALTAADGNQQLESVTLSVTVAAGQPVVTEGTELTVAAAAGGAGRTPAVDGNRPGQHK